MPKWPFAIVALMVVAGLAVADLGGVPRRLQHGAEAQGLPEVVGLSDPDAARQVDRLVAQAPAPQAAALEDADVSLVEYEAAVAETVACLREGFSGLLQQHQVNRALVELEVSPTAVSPDGFEITYSYTVSGPAAGTAPPSAFDTLTDLERACHERHQQQIEDVFQVRLLADDQYVRQVSGEFTACLAGGGVRLTEMSTRAVLSALAAGLRGADRELFIQCLTEVPSISTGLSAVAAGTS